MDPRSKTSGRATEPKCKLVLINSPESAHKKLELIAPVFFKLSCKPVKVLHTKSNVTSLQLQLYNNHRLVSCDINFLYSALQRSATLRKH